LTRTESPLTIAEALWIASGHGVKNVSDTGWMTDFHLSRRDRRFDDDEVYGSDGGYLGEILSENRLIIHCGKKSWRHSGFSPMRSGSYARYVNYVGYVMYAGYEDFPSPDEFK
jgi:hypothetical protein